ncbi:hypothetical protein DWF00_20300 [Bosea caraganae]|uniref:Chemotaxis protein n=1 Tax=Bosea caraganae TaxID=2763117 RepID=A0A370KYA6_9HYPH|nr:hypothetical protein [Bosea caraganae]RDJ19960.1 hypothetical protein DWE98_26825 [Bosea caraganae]RDJ23899.1 hypothetical protein DWF00_20300 [Bosea caraganae]
MSNDMLNRLTTSLSDGARQIDQTFAGVGDRLGRGLSIFDALNQSLTALSGELAGSDMEAARDALLGLAGDLRTLSEGLPHETRTLHDIATHSSEASQALERLLEHMRLIAILARSARIEAVSVQSNQRDFGDFTNEIVALTDKAKRTVENCARDHGHLADMLDSALVRQRAFETHYCGALLALAGKLEHSLDHLAERGHKSAALTKDAAAHSRKISTAVGGAIIALQSGDGIRQRLEHSLAALRLAISLAAPGRDYSEADRTALAAVLRALQAAQLGETAAALKTDIAPIDATLQVLADDTGTMLDLGHSLYGGEDASSASFLQELEAELAQAADLIRKCDAARSVVDQVTVALTGLLAQFEQTVAALSNTVRDIVLIGMNAGLRAARLGSEGRGLVVISQELKTAANQIAVDAGKLTPAFSAMQHASSGLKQRDGRGSSELNALASTMRHSLDQMKQSGARLGATLDQLARDGAEFGSIIHEARLMFSNAAATSDVITGAAGLLDERVPRALLAQADAGVVATALREQVWPSYTMAAERTIHGNILRECGIANEVAQPAKAAKAALDDVLF